MEFTKIKKLQQMPQGGKSYFITIPKAMIEILNWKKGDGIKITLKDEKLKVSKE